MHIRSRQQISYGKFAGGSPAGFLINPHDPLAATCPNIANLRVLLGLRPLSANSVQPLVGNGFAYPCGVHLAGVLGWRRLTAWPIGYAKLFARHPLTSLHYPVADEGKGEMHKERITKYFQHLAMHKTGFGQKKMLNGDQWLLSGNAGIS